MARFAFQHHSKKWLQLKRGKPTITAGSFLLHMATDQEEEEMGGSQGSACFAPFILPN